jgi:hypothetical protein
MNIKNIKKYYQVIGILGMSSILIYLLDMRLLFLNEYLKGFTLSFGIVLVIFSVFAKFNKKYIHKKEINAGDERIKMIQEKSLSAGYQFHNILTVLGVIIFGIFDQTYILSIGLAVMILAESIFIWIMSYYFHKTY